SKTGRVALSMLSTPTATNGNGPRTVALMSARYRFPHLRSFDSLRSNWAERDYARRSGFAGRRGTGLDDGRFHAEKWREDATRNRGPSVRIAGLPAASYLKQRRPPAGKYADRNGDDHHHNLRSGRDPL